MSNIKLSLMVTFCNQKEYIKDALDSCVNQKVNFDYEILVGLDNPDDESREIINEYIKKYPNIKLFEIDNSKLNITNIEKASNNRLNLLKQAKGEYICFLDGDDFYCDENRHQIMVDFLDNNPDYIAVFHDYVEYDNKLKAFFKVKVAEYQRAEFKTEKYLKIHRQYSCFLYRNIFKNQPKHYQELILLDDMIFTNYFLNFGKFYYLPKEMFAYRLNISSIFASKNLVTRFLYMLLLAEINYKILPNYKIQTCRKIRTPLKLCYKKINSFNEIEKDELDKIENFAKRHKCYFTHSLINYSKLNIFQKFKFNVYKFICIKLKKNLAK